MKFIILLLHFWVTFIKSQTILTKSSVVDESNIGNNSKNQLEIKLNQTEIKFLNLSSNISITESDRKSYSLIYLQSVRDIANELCYYISNSSICEEAVTTKSTKIHVSCIVRKNSTSGTWQVETKGLNNADNNDKDRYPTFFKARTGNENWTHCSSDDENKLDYLGSNNIINCYVVVQYNLHLRVDRLGSEVGPYSWEAFLIIDGKNILDINNTLNTTFQVSMQFEKIYGHSNATCARLIDEFGGWDTRVCKTKLPSDNLCVVECDCDGIGFFKLIYLDLIFNDSRNFEQQVSFWINSTYKDTNETCLEDFGNSLLLQIVHQLGFQSEISNSTLNDTVTLTLKLTKDQINVTLIFKNVEMWKNGSYWNSTAISKFISKLDAALLAGNLTLKDFNKAPLFIPVQKLLKVSNVEKGGSGIEAEAVFLWIVFASVFSVAGVFCIFALRKSRQESIDAVRPITYHAEDFSTSNDTTAVIRMRSGRNNVRTGIEEIFPTTQSMETILSDSAESFDASGGIRKRSFGNGSNDSQESMSPQQDNMRYEVFARQPTDSTAASLPDFIEEDMDRIYYIPPPSDANLS